MSIFQGLASDTNTLIQHSTIDDNLFSLPKPLTPTLITLGVSQKIAERLSTVYIRRASELKARTKEIMSDMLSKLSPCGSAEYFTTLQNDLYETCKQKYLSTLAVWSQEACELASRHVASQPTILSSNNTADDKKSKQRFKSEYLPLFEFAFSKDRFPSREDKRHLARVSGMSYRQISVWFQNRRCRSGKHSRASTRFTPETNETRQFECTTPTVKRAVYHQHDFNIEDCSTVDRWLNSPNIIDLTTDNVIPEEIMGSESSLSDSASSEVFTDPLETDSRLSFPAPYVPSAPVSDPFEIQLDSSLWPRRRGLKRPRASEHTLRVDDILSNLESMDVTITPISSHSRPMKCLPKRSRAGISLSSTSHPSPSFTCLSESMDEPPLSPASQASSYSTVASSPDLNGICLPPPLSLTFEYSEDKAGDQCLLDRIERPAPETFLYRFEFASPQDSRNEADVLSPHGEGLGLSLWSS